MTYSKELNAAYAAARAAGRIQLKMQPTLSGITIKSDNSPVTAVDKACENHIRNYLLKRFPHDGFLGEETGTLNGSSGRRWIVDPLDGTRPYIRGIPTYSSLIALEDEHRIVVGVAHLPALKETYWATHNGGAYCNNKSIHVSRAGTLANAMGASLGLSEKSTTPEGAALLSLMSHWNYTYGFMDVYSYMCVASGKLDVAVNLLDKPWDCAAAACIVTEAGGRASDILGNASIYNGSFVITNGALHDSALSYFKDIPR
jgi:histidinol phosphatase-like enzyme (inositol monophosphatase family)